MIDLTYYLRDSETDANRRPSWAFEFANGRTASVLPDTSLPFRFEVLVHHEPVAMRVHTGLTTDEVETKLREVRDLPPADDENGS